MKVDRTDRFCRPGNLLASQFPLENGVFIADENHVQYGMVQIVCIDLPGLRATDCQRNGLETGPESSAFRTAAGVIIVPNDFVYCNQLL